MVYGTFDSTGAMGRMIALSGTINFDGQGNYSFTGTLLDSSQSGTSPLTWNGAYATAASGLAKFDSPLFDQETVYGLVSRGVFIGSSTEGNTNDVVVAVAVGSPAASANTLKGAYWMGSIDYPGGDPAKTREALLQVTADGQGGIAATSAAGYIGTSSTAVNQSLAAFSYALNNGSGTLSLPTASGSQALLSGSKLLYVSPDGNFFAGGSANGYDLVFGVRAAGGSVDNSLFKGVYYLAGMDQDNSDYANSGSYFDTYYGSMSANNGTIIRNDRIAPFDGYAFDFGFDSGYSIASNGTYERSTFRYAVSASGLGVVGIGKGPTLGLFMAVRAPDFSGSGVYISPVGVVNAASNAPFTVGVSRGELITIYGSGLASGNAVATVPFPTTLGNVQVKINGRLAPIYFVSPTQVSAVVPYATEISYAQVQVINNGVASNAVTSFVNTSAPGVFTVPAGGVGYGAVLHADYTLVTPSNPAKKGETVLVYLTGLGDVDPAVTEGTAAPAAPLSLVKDTVSVYIDGVAATVSYAGLAPGLAGLYQVNVVVPASVGSGDVYIEVDGADGASSQVRIPVQ